MTVASEGGMIPIIYNKCVSFSGTAKFNHSECPKGGSVTIHGECVDVGWVFCGTQRDPDYPNFPLLHGAYLQIYGGKFELLQEDGVRWDGENSTGTIAIIHDGTSKEILVIYGTKAKQR